MSDVDLNLLTIPSDDGPVRLVDSSREHDDTRVYFKSIRSALIRHIEAADYVFGCVAWLTDGPILNALAKKRGVSLLVQKEDFLRPDGTGSKRGMTTRLRREYGQLRSVQRRAFSSGIADALSRSADQCAEAVRCVGINNRPKSSAAPRMHHKFAVFCKAHPTDPGRTWMLPYEVWTGSFNWSHNATKSFENAVVLQNPKVTKAYYLEFQQILALSEPLDWEHDWVAPQWRIGS